VLRLIKAGQWLFTLDEVADLLDAGRHRQGRRRDSGLRSRAQARLVEVQAWIADLQVIAGTLARGAGRRLRRPGRVPG
jgi:MerR family transcriptional regulator, mercuric resistance operon regulatory protein